MNIFKKFKVKFDLRKKVQSGKEKVDTAGEIKCLKYRIFSEFSQEQDFNINSSTSKEHSFKRVEVKNLNARSVSENDLHNNKQYQETNTDNTKNVAIKNPLWPSASALDLSNQKTEDFSHNNIHHNERIEEKDKVTEALPKNIKSILKNTNSKTKSDYEDSQPSYEPYERIDLDIQNEEEIYYFDQPQDEFEEGYVVHQINREEDEVSEHYYEEPIGRYDGLMTIQTNDKKSENVGVEFNSFGNTQKLRNPGMYSNEAMDIFFVNDVTTDGDHPASQIIFSDNLSEMSA